MPTSPHSKPITATPSGAAFAPEPEAASPPGPIARVVLAILRGYKLVLSPLFAGSCRFTPSCADYTAEAVRRHGAGAGTLLGLKRLARCHPWGPWGYDPVPPPKSSRGQARDGVSDRRQPSGAKVQ